VEKLPIIAGLVTRVVRIGVRAGLRENRSAMPLCTCACVSERNPTRVKDRSAIEDYALIGDCHGAGLVSKRGSIDWLCMPHFDSPACFAGLLGDDRHGHWSIAPRSQAGRITRRYRGDTLIIETRFETPHGRAVLIDFLLYEPGVSTRQLVRIVSCEDGEVDLVMELVMRFDYGSTVPWVVREDECLAATAGPDTLRLYADVPLHSHELHTRAAFRLGAGQRASFVLKHTPSHALPERPVGADEALARTERAWSAWSERSTYRGEYQASVQRSLLTLKALTYEPTGGIVAAPTTSLPEQLGGTRNWDYRYCWLRDATIALYSLLVSGYTEEAESWRNWLLRAVAGSPEQAQTLYGIRGERHIRELTLPWLPGFGGARPVRIGNAARTQLQIDMFGELMDAMHQCRENGVENRAGWALEKKLLEHLEHVWTEPDEGIWEIRSERRHFTHSKVMAWVAFDRAVRSVEQFGRDGPVERFRAARAAVHRDVCKRGFSTELNSFTQAYGSNALDASLLMLPLVGFLPAHDPRIIGTVAAIERTLLVDHTLVLRYHTHPELDGLPPGEGAFLPCSFWLVENQVMQGRTREARALFERLLALCNDVGLLAEEYDPQARCMLGNFPQAFSHLSLIDAAVTLSSLEHPPETHRIAPRRTTETGGGGRG
jgi:GH15 family glucan-1,4-alpha-glucosidase